MKKSFFLLACLIAGFQIAGATSSPEPKAAVDCINPQLSVVPPNGIVETFYSGDISNTVKSVTVTTVSPRISVKAVLVADRAPNDWVPITVFATVNNKPVCYFGQKTPLSTFQIFGTKSPTFTQLEPADESVGIVSFTWTFTFRLDNPYFQGSRIDIVMDTSY